MPEYVDTRRRCWKLNRRNMFHVPEPYRVRNGAMRSDQTFGNNGAFVFDSVVPHRKMAVIASDGKDWEKAKLEGEPWEHVSVHVFQGKKQFTPTWIEMCAVKDMFWDAEDVVMSLFSFTRASLITSTTTRTLCTFGGHCGVSYQPRQRLQLASKKSERLRLHRQRRN